MTTPCTFRIRACIEKKKCRVLTYTGVNTLTTFPPRTPLSPSPLSNLHRLQSARLMRVRGVGPSPPAQYSQQLDKWHGLPPRPGLAHVCLGLYVCIFWYRVKARGSLYLRRALHCTDWLLLGQSLNPWCWRAYFFVTERPRGYNIFMLGWAAPHFSLGSMGCVEDEASSQNRADSPQGYVGALELKSIQ